MSRLILLLALSAMIAHAGCEDPKAASHRAALDELSTLQDTLSQLQPGDTKAANTLAAVSRGASRIRSDDKTAQSIAGRIIAESELGLATLSAQITVTDMMEASALVGHVDAIRTGLDAIDALSARLRDSQDIKVDELTQLRAGLSRQMSAMRDARAQHQLDVKTIRQSVDQSLAFIQEKAQVAATLRSNADAADTAQALANRKQAAGVDLDAARQEAEMDRRKSVLELQADPQLQAMDISMQGLEDTITVIDDRSTSLEALAAARRQQLTQLQTISTQLDDELTSTTQSLTTLLTDSLAKGADTTRTHLEAAAKAASKAARTRNRKDGNSDRLLELQARVATAELSISETSLLQRCIASLSTAGEHQGRTISATWNETKNVLEGQVKAARAAGQSALDSATQLVDGFGSGQGDAIRTGLEALQASLDGDFSNLPSPDAATTPPPTPPSSIATSDAPAGLVQLANEFAAGSNQPYQQALPAMTTLMDCNAPSQPCKQLELLGKLPAALGDFSTALQESALGKDPSAAMMAEMFNGFLSEMSATAIGFKVVSIQETQPEQGTITISTGEMNTPGSISAAKVDGQWKLTGVPEIQGKPTPGVDQLQTMLTGFTTAAADLRSGKIKTAQQLKQAMATLAPR